MSDIRALGADISRHQTRLNFLGNLDFIILRASVGNTEDSRFRQHLSEAAPIPVRGAYHYMRSDSAWEDQLQTFQAIVQGAGVHFLALDFERRDNTFSRPFALATIRWLNTLSAAEARPVMLYTNPDNWNTGLAPFLSADELQHLAAFELWVAQWPNFPNESAARTSQRPALEAGPGMIHWTFWQFSGDAPTHPDRDAEIGRAHV